MGQEKTQRPPLEIRQAGALEIHRDRRRLTTATDCYEYVLKTYDVPARVRMRVMVYGKPGEIVRARSNLHRASLAWNPPRSHVVVEDEFVRMRAEAHFVHFARMLVFQIGLDHVAREHVALEEELVVRLKRIESLLQRSWRR